ncbi:MAG: hypothetical protein BJ554DRAFT_5199, partial [Olpidium bornovanus]
DQLVERVLAVRAGLAPDDGPRGVVPDLGTCPSHPLSVRFHVALLEVGREAVHVLVHAEQHREVLLERRGLEMDVHVVGALEKGLKIVGADVDADGQADRGPQAVAPTHPVPELEHVGLRDAEFGNRFGVGRERHEVLGNVALLKKTRNRKGGYTSVFRKRVFIFLRASKAAAHLFRGRQEPRLGAVGVSKGLLGGEGLACDDKQRGLRVDPLQHLGEVGAVHVADEVDVEAAHRVGPEGLGDHHGTKVGAADADVDDVCDALTGVPDPLARADPIGGGAHLGEDALDVGHDVLAIDVDGRGAVPDVAQRDVQHGAALRDVDLLACEHGVAVRHQAGLPRELEELGEGVLVDEVLAVVKQEAGARVRAGKFDGKLAEPGRVCGEQVPHDEAAPGGVVVCLQRLPSGEAGRGSSHCARREGRTGGGCVAWASGRVRAARGGGGGRSGRVQVRMGGRAGRPGGDGRGKTRTDGTRTGRVGKFFFSPGARTFYTRAPRPKEPPSVLSRAARAPRGDGAAAWALPPFRLSPPRLPRAAAGRTNSRFPRERAAYSPYLAGGSRAAAPWRAAPKPARGGRERELNLASKPGSPFPSHARPRSGMGAGGGCRQRAHARVAESAGMGFARAPTSRHVKRLSVSLFYLQILSQTRATPRPAVAPRRGRRRCNN